MTTPPASKVVAPLSATANTPRVRPPWPIGYYLIALVLVAVAPLLVVMGWMAWKHGQFQREAVERGLVRTAEALSFAVDRELGILQATLQTLAQSRLIDSRDFEGFYHNATRAVDERPGAWIVLFDPSGQQIINTSRPFGTPLPNTFESAREPAAGDDALPMGSVSAIKEAFATGRPSNSDLFVGITSKKPTITVDVPVIRDGKTLYVLAVGFLPDAFTALLQQGASLKGAVVNVVDRKGFIIGRSHNPEQFVARKTTLQVLDALDSASSMSIAEGLTHEGIDVYFTYARSELSGWTVAVAVPTAEVDTVLLWSSAVWLGAAVSGLLLSAVAALWLARRLGAPVVALATASSADATVIELPPKGVRTRELEQLFRSLQDGRRAQQEQAREREMRLVAETRREEAERSSRAKDQFLAMLGHELRNPLAAISNAFYAMERSNQSSAAMQAIARRQIEHLRKIIDDLLDIARVTSGKVRIQPEHLDLHELVESCVTSIVQTGLWNQHELRVHGEPVWIYADPNRMAQVANNLLENALKYTPAGGRIAVRVAPDGEHAIFEVADTGVGISQQMLPHVFEPFAQEDKSLDRSLGGLGLGLALVKGLVELHGGIVSAASDGLGRGARFTVRLPRVARPAVRLPETDAAARDGRRGGKRVLVVEDHEDSRRALRALLELDGHEVREAAEGATALSMLESSPTDVAFIDIGLPGMDGYAVAQAIRKDRRMRTVRLVALTGYGGREDRERAVAAGFDMFVAKPIDELALRRAIAGEQSPSAAVSPP